VVRWCITACGNAASAPNDLIEPIGLAHHNARATFGLENVLFMLALQQKLQRSGIPILVCLRTTTALNSVSPSPVVPYAGSLGAQIQERCRVWCPV